MRFILAALTAVFLCLPARAGEWIPNQKIWVGAVCEGIGGISEVAGLYERGEIKKGNSAYIKLIVSGKCVDIRPGTFPVVLKKAHRKYTIMNKTGHIWEVQVIGGGIGYLLLGDENAPGASL